LREWKCDTVKNAKVENEGVSASSDAKLTAAIVVNYVVNYYVKKSSLTMSLTTF